jgi:hypothetical protein
MEGGEKMKFAAVFTVGTSTGGAPAAISEVLNQMNQLPEDHTLHVYLLHGEKGNDDKDPKKFAEEIKSQLTDSQIQWQPIRQVPSFDFERTWPLMRKIISEIAEASYDYVYVGITGGTNPMVASLFHAAMTYLDTRVVPVYTQSQKTDWCATFVASEIRDRTKAEEVLKTARSGQLQVASRLAEHLPDNRPEWGFVRKAVSALASWDDFDYGSASNLSQLARKPEACKPTNEMLAPLAETVARLASLVKSMNDFIGAIRDPRRFSSNFADPKFLDEIQNTGVLLVADALANAQRRLTEGRYTDAVLRSYRAAECASQMCLFSIGVHPSRPDPDPPSGGQPSGEGLQEKTSPLSFWAGLKRFEDAKNLSRPEEICNSLKKLSEMRNRSYLEHGYVRINQKQAKRCYADSQKICAYLLGHVGCDSDRFMALQKELEMHF